MRREFVPFDEQIIEKEMDALPPKDAAKLIAIMRHYEQCGRGNPAPAQIDEYGGGIFRIRHAKSAYQGRAVYFCLDTDAGAERLVILVICKKEGTKVPSHILSTAQRRKQQWQQRQ